jgi:hypothetical protein
MPGHLVNSVYMWYVSCGHVKSDSVDIMKEISDIARVKFPSATCSTFTV